MNSATKELINKIKTIRKEKRLSQVELAAKIGVGKSIISAWELDQHEPSLSNIKILAKFFKVTADYLVGLEDE